MNEESHNQRIIMFMQHLVPLNVTKKLCNVMNNGMHTWHRVVGGTKVDGFFLLIKN